MSHGLRKKFKINLREHIPEPGERVLGTDGKWEYNSIRVKTAADGIYGTVFATYRLAADPTARAPAKSRNLPSGACIRPSVDNIPLADLEKMRENQGFR